jgi:BirA family transcriptional regulator, biotin operon repressor / biotin---[acetyl-CoA-carboxylase] ligase
VGTIRWLDEVDSTTRVARAENVGHGDAIATTNQTAGRGRQDRTWNMEPGHGLALTLVLSRAAIGSPKHITRLPLLVAVELRRVIESIAPPGTSPTVKWPNDVHIQARKVSGILVEVLDDDRIGIGIGINLAGIPAEVSPDAATYLEQHGITISSDELATALTDAIVRRAPEVDSDALLDELASAIDTIGREVRLELPDGRIVTGRATGIGVTGSLCMDVSGVVDEFSAADVTHLRLGSDERR